MNRTVSKNINRPAFALVPLAKTAASSKAADPKWRQQTSVLITALFLALVTTHHVDRSSAADPPTSRNLKTDEPRKPKGKPEGAPEYVATPAPADGRHLALTMQKLNDGITPDRPFVIWALGSSYTNMLGNGEFWRDEIPKHFPNAPQIEYHKMVGNSCPWQYLRGWARHLVIPDQPDLVITYTIGKPDDLEKLIIELRKNTTADIIVPSIHWRERDQSLWGKSENAADQDVAAVRAVCDKYDVEFVESRRDWGEYLRANNLPIESLLKDAVHQSEYGAQMINRNILAHLRIPDRFSYAPAMRERRIRPIKKSDGGFEARFTGNRIDIHGTRSADGGTFKVLIDGKPADQIDSFLVSYVQPGGKNSKDRVGNSPTVPRDTSPHGITLGNAVVPQSWTITMTSDTGDYEIVGSLTGTDGNGNAFHDFTSASGQIIIEPELWRRAERNRKGDTFTFDVKRSVVPEVSFKGTAGEHFVARIAQVLPNHEHRLELSPVNGNEAIIDAFEVFQPPMVDN
ncbi:MAG: SGNH/GDSL hydrolase family protein [Planctomycetales bacterium]|nr:SGNH/GDSL hydrolase family protein [Planctomycetales bacterium]